MEKKFYIEDTSNAQVLHGSIWRQYVGDSDVSTYPTLTEAENAVQNLSTGVYKIIVLYHVS